MRDLKLALSNGNRFGDVHHGDLLRRSFGFVSFEMGLTLKIGSYGRGLTS
jgi:hypothetical protein